MTASTSSDPVELQEAFLHAQHVTPILVRDTLERLLSLQVSHPLHLWISMAALHALTDSQLAKRITSIEAVSSLLQVGLKASEKLNTHAKSASSPHLRRSDEPTQAVSTQLDVIKSSFQAWEKTGMVVHTGSTAASAWQDLGDDEEEEDSAWFDSRGTPSPPASTAPSIQLATLIRSLSDPALLGSLIAPYPSRLVVWLKGLPPSIYSVHVWPQRLDIVKSGLLHHAIGGDSAEVVRQLELTRLLPALSDDDMESSIWVDLRVGGEVDRAEQDSEVSDEVRSSRMDIEAIGKWLASIARLLTKDFQATTLSSALAEVAVRMLQAGSNASHPEIHTVMLQLRQVQEECEIVASTGLPYSDCKVRDLLMESASSITTLCSDRINDPAALSRVVKFVSRRTARTAAAVAREAAFWAYNSPEASKESVLMLVSEAAEGSKEETEKITMSMLLASRSGGRAALLSPLLQDNGRPGNKASESLLPEVAIIFPALVEEGKLSFSGSLVLPSSEGVYRFIDERIAKDDLQSRCRSYISCVTQTGLIAVEVARLAPYIVILGVGNGVVQKSLIKQLLANVAKSRQLNDAADWLRLSDDLLLQTGSAALFDAVAQEDVIAELLKGALLSENSSAAYSLLKGHLPSLSISALDSIIISSAREVFDRVQGGRAGVADLRKVRDILSLSSSNEPSSPIALSQNFLKSVLRLMQLGHPLSSTLHPSLLMSPVEIRLTSDKVDVIRHWLSSSHDAAWKREDDVIETALGLAQGSESGMLGEPRQEKIEEETGDSVREIVRVVPSNKALIKIRVLALLAEAAMANNDVSFTTHHVDSLLQTFKEMTKRSRRVNGDASVNLKAKAKAQEQEQENLNRAQEVVWTTLFLLSKHPNCTSVSSMRLWLAEGLAYAPEERVSDLLKRWRALPPAVSNIEVIASSGGSFYPSGMGELFRVPDVGFPGSKGSGLNVPFISVGGGSGSDRGISPSPRFSPSSQAGTLGAGVFSLAAGVVNRSPWPLRLGGGGASGSRSSLAEQGDSTTTTASGVRSSPLHDAKRDHAYAGGGLSLSSTSAGVGHALSSLAGQFTGEGGYTTRLSGFLSSSSHAAGTSRSNQGEVQPGNQQVNNAYPSTSTSTQDDKVERSSVAHLFDDDDDDGEGGRYGRSSTSGGGGRWTSLSSRGMGWLMGESEGENRPVSPASLSALSDPDPVARGRGRARREFERG